MEIDQVTVLLAELNNILAEFTPEQITDFVSRYADDGVDIENFNKQCEEVGFPKLEVAITFD